MGCASTRSHGVNRGLRRQAPKGGVVRRVLRQEVRWEVRGGEVRGVVVGWMPRVRVVGRGLRAWRQGRRRDLESPPTHRAQRSRWVPAVSSVASGGR